MLSKAITETFSLGTPLQTGDILLSELSETVISGHFLPSVPLDQLYQPAPGSLRQKTPERFTNDKGVKFIGTYCTARAMHEVRIYTPDNLDDTIDAAKVIMTTPLGTGIEGHNDKVAQEIASTDCVVILKGVPRYYNPRRALNLTEDANEVHGLLNALEDSTDLRLGKLDHMYAYGESQAAMKLLGIVATAGLYDRTVVDGLAVAACFIEPANLRNVRKLLRYGTSMVGSIRSAAKMLSAEEIWDLRQTIDIRDVHNHLAVIPTLMSGEAGTFLPHISRDQLLSNQFFGKDRSSRAHRAKLLMDTRFPRMQTYLNEQYGHADGIISPGTKELRRKVFSDIVQQTLAQAA